MKVAVVFLGGYSNLITAIQMVLRTKGIETFRYTPSMFFPRGTQLVIVELPPLSIEEIHFKQRWVNRNGASVIEMKDKDTESPVSWLIDEIIKQVDAEHMKHLDKAECALAEATELLQQNLAQINSHMTD